MLGALEVRAITRLAAQRGSEWKSLHTAVMDCLLAHRNRRSGDCRPHRRTIAAHCNVSERTIDRILAELVAWGAITRQQPRAVSSQQIRPAQYAFLFELPQSVENACELEEKNCEDLAKPCAKIHPSRAPNSGGAVRQIRGANKEEEKDLKGKDRKGGNAPPPSQFSQSDFDARDLRKIGAARKRLNQWLESHPSSGQGMTNEAYYTHVAEESGLTIKRIFQLEETQREWPAKEGTG